MPRIQVLKPIARSRPVPLDLRSPSGRALPF
jgi:hypothetical protein